MNVWRLGRRHYGYRVYEGTRPVANFREKEDAALAVRLHNDHVRGPATPCADCPHGLDVHPMDGPCAGGGNSPCPCPGWRDPAIGNAR